MKKKKKLNSIASKSTNDIILPTNKLGKKKFDLKFNDYKRDIYRLKDDHRISEKIFQPNQRMIF